MLQDVLQTTPVNTQEKQETHGKQFTFFSFFFEVNWSHELDQATTNLL
jgi:hypothetical protein